MWRNHRYYCQLSANPKDGALVECQRMLVPDRKGRILGREAVRCGLVCCSCHLIFCNYDCLQFHKQSCVEGCTDGRLLQPATTPSQPASRRPYHVDTVHARPQPCAQRAAQRQHVSVWGQHTYRSPSHHQQLLLSKRSRWDGHRGMCAMPLDTACTHTM
jgi:hypothetical protein